MSWRSLRPWVNEIKNETEVYTEGGGGGVVHTDFSLVFHEAILRIIGMYRM